jgi:hypothetical protein
MQFVRRAVEEFVHIPIVLILGFLLLAKLTHQPAPEPFFVLLATARVLFHLPRVLLRTVDFARSWLKSGSCAID